MDTVNEEKNDKLLYSRKKESNIGGIRRSTVPRRLSCNKPEPHFIKEVDQDSLKQQDQVTEDFNFNDFLEILKKEPTERDLTDANYVIRFLKDTDLMNKFKSDREISQASYNQIMYICSIYINIQILKPKQILFKIDDIGDRFYIILKGTVDVLKPVPLPKILMTTREYFDYLLGMRSSNEKYLLNRTLKENSDTLNIPDIYEFERICAFIIRFIYITQTNKFDNYASIEHLVSIYNKSIQESNIDKDSIKNLDQSLRRHSYDHYKADLSEKKWLEEIDYKIKIADYEQESYINYILTITKDMEYKGITTFEYKKFISLKKGQYFGDMALDNLNKKRTATIQASDECFLGHISNKVYEEHIQAEKLKVRNKEIMFLNENFFFKIIPNVIFTKKYFSLFASYTFPRNYQVFREGSVTDKLVFVKDGCIEVSYTGNVLDINNTIRILVNKYVEFSNTPLGKTYTSQDDIIFLKSLLDDQVLSNLRNKSQKFLTDIKVKKIISISKILSKDILGMEEVFLGNLDRLMKATVHSDISKMYLINLETLKSILDSEKKCLNIYMKICNEKVVSLIKRLYNIKQTFIAKSLNECKLEENLRGRYKSETENQNGIKIKKMIKIVNSSRLKSNDSTLKLGTERLITNTSMYNEKRNISFYNKDTENKFKLKKIEPRTTNLAIPENSKQNDLVFLTGGVSLKVKTLSSMADPKNLYSESLSNKKQQKVVKVIDTGNRKSFDLLHSTDCLNFNSVVDSMINQSNLNKRKVNNSDQSKFYSAKSSIVENQLPYIKKYKRNNVLKKSIKINKDEKNLDGTLKEIIYLESNPVESQGNETEEFLACKKGMLGYRLLSPAFRIKKK
jgi:hypothetical protein